MAHTMQTINAGAATTLRVSISTIDTIAALAIPVYQAGQRCGARYKQPLRQAIEQIDWQEVLTIVIGGILICAIASWRALRWSHAALIQCSSWLGQRYAAHLAPAAAVVDHEPAIREPQPALPSADAPQRAARTKVSKLPKPAPKPSRQRRAKGSSRTTAPALA